MNKKIICGITGHTGSLGKNIKKFSIFKHSLTLQGYLDNL
jgi:hypothetical protein